MNPRSLRTLDSFVGALALCLVVAATAGCPAGTQTTVQAGVGVQVDPAHCQESDGGPSGSSIENVVLSCSAVTGSGTVTVKFPRAAWSMVRLDGGTQDAGPGK